MLQENIDKIHSIEVPAVDFNGYTQEVSKVNNKVLLPEPLSSIS